MEKRGNRTKCGTIQKTTISISLILFSLILTHSAFSGALEQESQGNVSIIQTGYVPQVLTVPAGTSILWTNLDSVHTSTSLQGLWDSGVLDVGESFEYNFQNVGVYPYYDSIHDWLFGTIKVVHSLASISLSTDRAVYASGDTMNVALEIRNPGDPVNVGIYVWADRPDGSRYWALRMDSVTLPEDFSYSNPRLAYPQPSTDGAR